MQRRSADRCIAPWTRAATSTSRCPAIAPIARPAARADGPCDPGARYIRRRGARTSSDAARYDAPQDGCREAGAQHEAVTEEPEKNDGRVATRYVFIAGIALLVLVVIWVLLKTFVVNFASDVRPL